MTVGKYIQQQRARAGLTRNQFADKIGSSAGYIQRIESDAVTPSARMIHLIAGALHIDPDDLFELALMVPPDMQPWICNHLTMIRRIMQGLP